MRPHTAQGTHYHRALTEFHQYKRCPSSVFMARIEPYLESGYVDRYLPRTSPTVRTRG
jgi:hypothetical protein